MNESGMSGAEGAIGLVVLLIYLVILIGAIAGGWKVFAKAGEPGWAILVPIYNIIVFLKICGRPLWWIVLMLIPFVSIVISIILCLDLAKKFGKGAGYAVGLFLLGFIFLPMLGFGDAQYEGDSDTERAV